MLRIDAEIERGTSEIWIIRNEGKNWSHPIHSHFTEFILQKINGRPVQREEIQTTASDNPRRKAFVPLTAEIPQHPSHRNFSCPEDCKDIKVPVFMGGNRRDITTLLPDDEIEIYMNWSDFHGRYVMHCHNVVHEDYSMMVRWDIVPQQKGKKPQLLPEVDDSEP